jgi:putative sigma-54 modulation protein
MQIIITARHFDITPEMKERAEADIEGLTRYFENIISAELVLEVERHRRIAELHVKVFNNSISGTGDTDDMYNSIGVAVDKVKGQLKKYKGKLKERRPEEIYEKIDELTRPATNPEEIDQ